MRNTAIGAVAGAALLAGMIGAGPAPAAPAAGKKPARTASVHGAARIAYIESMDHDIRFTIHAEQTPFTRPFTEAPTGMATDARGTVKFSHTVPGTDVEGWAEADVDCLVTSGRTATLTAVVTDSNVHEPGLRLGFSVQQGARGGPDRLGFSWGVVNVDLTRPDESGGLTLPNAGTCMAPAPFTTVVKGGFKVVHAEIAKTPAQPGQEIGRG